MAALNPDLALNPMVTELLEALRLELQEYGEMLALLSQQQDSMLRRAAEDVLRSVSSINEQMVKVQQARGQRESCQGQIVRHLHCSDDIPLAELIPLLPEAFRVAVGSLVRENNDLLFRVQKRVRQNHLLLGRSLQLMQQIVHALLPGQQLTTYSDTGQVQGAAAPSLGLYEAVG